MRDEINIDYETSSDLDLTEVGAWKYAAHSSTKILCLSVSVNRAKPILWAPTGWYEGLEAVRLYSKAVNERWIVRGWNVLSFERAITELVLPRYITGWKSPRVEDYRDTMALAAYLALPMSLEACAAFVGASAQKDKEGRRLINLFSQRQTRSGKWVTPRDAPEDFYKLCLYCNRDVLAEIATRDAMPEHDLPEREQEICAWDSEVNKRGIGIDLSFARGAISIMGICEGRERAKLVAMTGNQIQAENQHAKIKAWCRRYDYAIGYRNAKGEFVSTTDAQAVDLALADPKLPDQVRAVLEVRSQLGKASTKKYHAMVLMAGDDGRVRGAHRYHKAHPGRWSGTGVQFQNVPRGKIKLTDVDRQWIRDCALARVAGETQEAYNARVAATPAFQMIDLLYSDVMAFLRDALRNAVVAQGGKVLSVVDEASIEFRCLAWISGDAWCNEMLATGKSSYKEMGGKIFSCPADSFDKESMQYFMGKKSVLALGYSMWVDTFDDSCRKEGVNVDRPILELAVNTYRKTCPGVVKSWKIAEAVMGHVIATRATVKALRCTFTMEGEATVIVLPSGRKMWYPKATVRNVIDKWGRAKVEMRYMARDDKSGGMHWSKLYGGLIIENICQAVARDLLAHAMLRAEKELGVKTIMHVHDEQVVEDERSRVEEIAHIMKQGAPWSSGMVLGAEGFVSTYYKK